MRRTRSLRLALVYAAISVLWITATDSLGGVLGLSPAAMVRYSQIKGIGFVVVTSLALYFLVNRFARVTEEREREYRELFEQNPNPMWFYDLDTLAFLKVNDAAVHKYGYTKEEFAAMTIADIRPPEDLRRLRANVEAVRAGEAIGTESGAWRHITKDGRILWVDISSHVIDFEGHRAEAVLIRDLTEAHAARQELVRLQREQLERDEARRWAPAE